MKLGKIVVARAPEDGAGSGGAPAGGAPAGGDAGGGPTPPEGVPAQFWSAEKGVDLTGFTKHYNEIAAFKSDYDAKQAALPPAADAYKFEITLPEDLKVPEGYEFKIDPKDPRIPSVREFAFKHRLSQDVVTELLTLNAKFEAEKHAAMDAELQAEFKKLGSNGQARVDAAKAYLKANLSNEEFEAAKSFIGDATAFAAIEKLIAKATTQRIPSGGDDPPKDPPVSKPRTADLFYGARS